MSRKAIVAITIVGLVILAAFFHANPTNQSAQTLIGEATTIDGDTIRIDGRVKVRLSGVAAPERNEDGGSAATSFMRKLVDGKELRCELNGERTHDRLVGICYLDGKDIGKAIIENGLARDCPRYSHGRYATAERRQAASLPFPGYCRER
jgi:micrococcal nuclease